MVPRLTGKVAIRKQTFIKYLPVPGQRLSAMLFNPMRSVLLSFFFFFKETEIQVIFPRYAMELNKHGLSNFFVCDLKN